MTQTGIEAGCSSPKADPSSLRFRLRPALRAPAVAELWRGKPARQDGFWFQLKGQKSRIGNGLARARSPGPRGPLASPKWSSRSCQWFSLLHDSSLSRPANFSPFPKRLKCCRHDSCKAWNRHPACCCFRNRRRTGRTQAGSLCHIDHPAGKSPRAIQAHQTPERFRGRLLKDISIHARGAGPRPKREWFLRCDRESVKLLWLREPAKVGHCQQAADADHLSGNISPRASRQRGPILELIRLTGY